MREIQLISFTRVAGCWQQYLWHIPPPSFKYSDSVLLISHILYSCFCDVPIILKVFQSL